MNTRAPPYKRHRFRRMHSDYGDTFFIDEVFVKIQGKQRYLWRAVKQDGGMVDVFLQAQRFLDVHAAICNLFNLGRHLISARDYQELRHNAFWFGDRRWLHEMVQLESSFGVLELTCQRPA